MFKFIFAFVDCASCKSAMNVKNLFAVLYAEKSQTKNTVIILISVSSLYKIKGFMFKNEIRRPVLFVWDFRKMVNVCLQTPQISVTLL